MTAAWTAVWIAGIGTAAGAVSALYARRAAYTSDMLSRAQFRPVLVPVRNTDRGNAILVENHGEWPANDVVIEVLPIDGASSRREVTAITRQLPLHLMSGSSVKSAHVELSYADHAGNKYRMSFDLVGASGSITIANASTVAVDNVTHRSWWKWKRHASTPAV